MKFSIWVDGALWRSWLFHGIAGALVALPFGGRAAFATFLVRELEQVYWARRGARPFEPWYDYMMDLVGPALIWRFWP